MGGIVVVLAFAAVVAAVFLLITLKRMLYVVPPNQALILSGARRRFANRLVGYRVVCGGRALRIPLLEQVDIIDLRNINIDVEVKGAFSKGGIPLDVKAVANVKLPGEEPMIHNAVERFLGRTRNEIMYIAKETLEGNLRGVLAQLTPEQVNEDKNRFTQILTEEAEHDLAKLGVRLDQLKIQNVTDDVGYLNSIGRIRGAALRQKAVIAEKQAQAQAAVKKANNWKASEVARYDAEISIAAKEMHKRIVDARGRRDAMIAAAKGEVAAQIAKVRAEIKRQQARAVQVQRMLEADVVQPADAARLKAEEEARGRAAAVVERGKAEAGALRQMIEAYRKGGAAAKEVLALQSVLPLVGQISGAAHPLRISKVTVLPRADNPASESLTRRLIGASEQLKAATGVDLGVVASRLGAAAPTASKQLPTPPPQRER
jgi:flotillin